jgi:DUF4097 and DUF4098 domain-containing protein YvlB
MSVSEEKLLILRMLQEGKITSEEAAKLLEALEGSSKQSANENTTRQQRTQPNFQDEIFKVREKVKEWQKDIKENYNQKDFDRAVEEFSAKAEKVGKNLATTTFGIVDKMIDFVGSFVDTNSFNIFGSYSVVERTFEAAATEGMDIEIEGTNGYIQVKKHLENKVIIKSKVRSPQNNADNILIFSDTGNLMSVKTNKTGNISVSHEVFLPEVNFNKVNLVTTNGKIYVEDTKSQSFEAITRNAHIDLMGVNSDQIKLNTRNAKIQMGYVIGRKIEINTNNSVIDIKHVKSENIRAVTVNGRISVENAQNLEGAPDLNLFLTTANGGIKVNMNDMDNRGYKVKGKTTNGGINLLIPEMTYHNVNRHEAGGSFIEAESNGYESYPERVSITAETVNGYIEIVK